MVFKSKRLLKPDTRSARSRMNSGLPWKIAATWGALFEKREGGAKVQAPADRPTSSRCSRRSHASLDSPRPCHMQNGVMPRSRGVCRIDDWCVLLENAASRSTSERRFDSCGESLTMSQRGTSTACWRRGSALLLRASGELANSILPLESNEEIPATSPEGFCAFSC